MNRALEQHRYHEVAEELWQFFWHDFCDWYLEIKKLRLSPNSGLTNDWRNLLNVFSAYLRLQHPVMPFITEELWHRFGENTLHRAGRLSASGATDEAAEREMALLQEMITAARKLRADHGLDKKLELEGRALLPQRFEDGGACRDREAGEREARRAHRRRPRR